METEFNLLDEKWILVRKSDCTTDELSLTDALLRSHEYTALSGELPTQDVSILRLLLAVLHTVFSRYTPEGEYKPVSSANEAMGRWETLWDGGKFPEKPIREYLESQHEKFWLFHPERPFYQTKAAEKGTEYMASKMNGVLSESSNKVRLFSSCAGKSKDTLTYSEAARWLLYVNSYDDTSAKASQESKSKENKLPSLQAGWLGKLGLITVRGNSLFETLMFNFIVVEPSNREIWADEKPTWELEKPREKERCEIATPDNLAELYTIQSRRLILKHENNSVTGYSLLGGDFFDKVDAFIEPMTVWGKVKESEKTQIQFQPRRHNSSVKMWREFASVFASSDGMRLPGVVSWIDLLRQIRLIDKKRYSCFNIASVQYGDKDFFVNDIFSDSLTFHTDLLIEDGKRWQKSISEEVGKCEDIARKLGKLAADIEIAAGSSPKDAPKSATVSHVQEQYYYEIDVPFREWLLSIDPEWESGSHEEHECIHKWHETSRNIARKLGKELVNSAEASAIVGRFKDKENGGKKREYISAARAFTDFMCVVNLKYPKEEQNG